MNREGCERCERLERELEKARRKIERLERTLERIANLCLGVLNRAAPILGQRSGVPRGLWSRVRGRVDVAELVLRCLE